MTAQNTENQEMGAGYTLTPRLDFLKEKEMNIEFEKKLEELTDQAWDQQGRDLLTEGAFFGFGEGYKQGIKAAIGMLRNEKEIDDDLGMHERSHDDWADWLEEKFEVKK